MVISRFGIVGTNQPLASAAAVKVLESGGNAVDAAVTANAMMGLVEPMSDGLGGDLFAIIYEAKTGKLYGLNASGWSPSGLTIDLLKSKGMDKMPATGFYTVTVPGVVAGWDAMRSRFGTMSFQQLLAPAIYYADNGFPVTELIAQTWQNNARKLGTAPESAKLYLPGGTAPHAGQLFRNPDLATSLKRIAAKGRDGFYKGPTAEAMLSTLNAGGSTMTADDLASFQPEWIAPVSTTYRGWTVSELPPNGIGIAALEMLNIMEPFPIGEYGPNSAKALHVMIEAKKLAYADLLKYGGDPKFAAEPIDALLSKELGAQRGHEIDMQKANCHVLPANLAEAAKTPGSDTTYMTVIDREGNIVSFIQSNFGDFGANIVAPGTGFALQNRGAAFTMEPGLPNSLAPHKRALSTIIPAFMQKGDVKIGFGIMNGWNQAQAHVQFVSNVVDHKMNIQEALDAPRFTKLSFDGCDVTVESRVPEAVRKELQSLGHEVRTAGPYIEAVGGGHAVMLTGDGTKYGASDPRKDGESIPQSPPFPGLTAPR